MAKIKLEYYTTDCTCPAWAKDNPAHCSGSCYDCGYPKQHRHIVQGDYKKVEYNETAGTFSYGNRKVEIEPDDPIWQNWIEHLEIDGEIVVGGEDDD